MMPTVDFYILEGANQTKALRYACQLLAATYANGNSVFVYMNSFQEAEQFDGLLWTYHDISFVPHQLYRNTPTEVPIQIGYQQPQHRFQVLVNLQTQLPDFYQTYEHIIEIVHSDPTAQQAARIRYKQYRDANCTLQTNKLKVSDYDYR